MELAVLLREQPDGTYEAKVPTIPGLIISAQNRDYVVAAMRCAVAEARPGSEPVFIDVPRGGDAKPNPWLEMAGMFADDPTWDEFIAEIRAARARDDASARDNE